MCSIKGLRASYTEYSRSLLWSLGIYLTRGSAASSLARIRDSLELATKERPRAHYVMRESPKIESPPRSPQRGAASLWSSLSPPHRLLANYPTPPRRASPTSQSRRTHLQSAQELQYPPWIRMTPQTSSEGASVCPLRPPRLGSVRVRFLCFWG